MRTSFRISSKTLCMVFVQRRAKSAPAASTARKASPSITAIRSHSPSLLQGLDLGEIDRVKDDPGRMETAELLLDRLVDDPVVFERRFPAHAADESDRFHLWYLLTTASISPALRSISATILNWVRARSRLWPSRWTLK